MEPFHPFANSGRGGLQGHVDMDLMLLPKIYSAPNCQCFAKRSSMRMHMRFPLRINVRDTETHGCRWALVGPYVWHSLHKGNFSFIPRRPDAMEPF